MGEDLAAYHVSTHETGGKQVKVVDVRGVLDIHTTRHFEKTISDLLGAGDLWIIVNLNHCGYISSAGLGALMGGAKQLRSRGGDLLLADLPRKILEIVKLVGFDKVLKIFKNEREALADLGKKG